MLLIVCSCLLAHSAAVPSCVQRKLAGWVTVQHKQHQIWSLVTNLVKVELKSALRSTLMLCGFVRQSAGEMFTSLFSLDQDVGSAELFAIYRFTFHRNLIEVSVNLIWKY